MTTTHPNRTRWLLVAGITVAWLVVWGGGGLLTARTVGPWRSTGTHQEADLIVWFNPKDAPEGNEAVRRALLEHPDVTGIVWYSQADALAEFRCLFADQPSMLNSIEEDMLPPSYRIRLGGGDDPGAVLTFQRRFQAMPGVRQVSEARQPQTEGASAGLFDRVGTDRDPSSRCRDAAGGVVVR